MRSTLACTLALGCGPVDRSPRTADDCAALLRARDAGARSAGCLVIEVPAGARLTVDGVATEADAPPVTTVAPEGARAVEVGANGHALWRGTAQVDAGTVTRLSPPLEETPQRLVSYGLLGLAGASAATAIALGVVSVVRAREAEDVVRRFSGDGFPEFERLQGLADQFRVGSGIAGGGALVSFVVGVSLFAFDDPDVGAPRAAFSIDGSF